MTAMTTRFLRRLKMLLLCLAAALVVAPAVPLPAAEILTPPAPATPRINGAKVFGARPGSPFLFAIPATGERPMQFSADNLPRGLKLDARTGRITGKLKKPGEIDVTLRAKNSLGAAEEKFRIVCGNTIALTPPMGWNSWNCFAGAVSADKVKHAADALVKSGLAQHGWTYINIDDYWQNHRNSKDPALRGPFRDASGNIVPNSRFPDMKSLAAYIHGLGLKAGLYSSPGPWTCGGCAGSWQHEEPDAKTYAAWGFDYLKYDWCSYVQTDTNRTWPTAEQRKKYERDMLKQPYRVMHDALVKQPRDIVFSLCQYGMGNVWEWGAEVGGNCWRTTDDITDTWQSMSNIGFKQDPAVPFAGPGHWNDPARSGGAVCIRPGSRRTNNTRTSASGACSPRRCSSGATWRNLTTSRWACWRMMKCSPWTRILWARRRVVSPPTAPCVCSPRTSTTARRPSVCSISATSRQRLLRTGAT